MSTGGNYEPQAIEQEIYARWESSGAFHALPDPARRPFVIDIPLPNVTGALHLGHALNNTLQDVLIRYHRMRGYNALWMPGTDHAGIATQAVVERKLKEEENLTRHQLGREGLVKRIWEWKEDYGGRILNQLRRLGASADWPRTRFTLDEVCAKAVFEVFFEWFKAGLIYRGTRLVNWDAYLQTAVADDEIVYETVKGHFWHFRYPLLDERHAGTQARRHAGIEQNPSGSAGPADAERSRDQEIERSSRAPEPRPAGSDSPSEPRPAGSGSPSEPRPPGSGFAAMQRVPDDVAQAAIANATREGAQLGVDYMAIATTRPETMLGDVALCVHPDDPRYKDVIGKFVLLPLQNRAIPVIADPELAKMELGTGCVKVTPGHDPNDYACGLRNNLPMLNILTPDGKLNTNGGAYAGQERYVARKQVVADLQALNLVEKIEDYETQVGHSDRSKTPIEPMLSEQWFVKMSDLAELAMEAARDGRVRFFPERYKSTFLDWLGEKRDWCISRQLWWGHRIPVWHVTLSQGTGIASGLQEQRAATRARCATELQAALDAFAQAERLGKEVFKVSNPGDLPSNRLYICARTAGAQKRLDDFAASKDKHGETIGVADKYDDALLVQQYPELARLIGALRQDEDVLDTWFSSALWPFSTLGWPHGPERAPGDPTPDDLAYFYPTSVLVTARDIITLWVARMVIAGLYQSPSAPHFPGRVPFQHVYIHPNIQDGQGRRMNKSLGNGVDPVDIITSYGADALRFTMCQMATETQDARLPVSYQCPHCGQLTAQSSVVPHNKAPREIHEATCKNCKQKFATVWAPDAKKAELGVAIDTSERFEIGRNLCNKLWQATVGFVLPNIQGIKGLGDSGIKERVSRGENAPSASLNPPIPQSLSPHLLPIEDRWILSRLAATVADVDRRFATYQTSDIAATLYAFFWNDFCDWYVELVKPRLFRRDEATDQVVPRTEPTAQVARRVLAFVLDQTLRLLQPMVPFITEALWQKLGEVVPRRGLDGLVAGAAPLADAEPLLIKAAWPDAAALPRDPLVEREMAALQDIIRALRDMLARINQARSASKEPAIGKLPSAVIRADAAIAAGLHEMTAVLERLGRCEQVIVAADAVKPAEAATQVLTGVEVYVPLTGLMDLAAERTRLTKERNELAAHVERIHAKLRNEGFVARAPAAVVEQERARLADYEQRLTTLERNLADLA